MSRLVWPCLIFPYVDTMPELLDRDKGTVSRHITKKNKVMKKKGQALKVTDKTVDKLLTIRDSLAEKAYCRWAVIVKMLRIAGRVEACDRTILNAFRARGIYVRRFQQKPALTKEDVKARLRFG